MDAMEHTRNTTRTAPRDVSAQPVAEGDLQRLVDSLFEHEKRVDRLDAQVLAETYDLDDEELGVVEALPPGTYTRGRLTDQLNSILTARGLGATLGTVE